MSRSAMSRSAMPRLFVFSGLPGTGKSTVAQALARHSKAIWLRVDSIESAITQSTLNLPSAEDAGYLAALALARDNLALGQDVIADMVNADQQTRDWWCDMGAKVGATVLRVWITCDDPVTHRARIAYRQETLQTGPDWTQVQARAFDPWDDADLRLDTAQHNPDVCAAQIMAYSA